MSILTILHQLLTCHQTKDEKTQYIHRFINDYRFQILCATSGIDNAGLDCKEVRAVFQIDMPSSIFDLV